MKKILHGMLRAMDPPREHPPRRWKCAYCGDEGFYDDVMSRACTYDYEPCKHCGEKGECAKDCPFMLALLGGASTAEGPGSNPKLYVAGTPLRDQTRCPKCVGYRIYPTKDQSKWPPGKEPDEIGYVFVRCDECGGTGKVSNAAEA